MKLLSSIRAVLTPVLITAGLLGGCAGFALADTPPVDATTAPELSCANARFVKSITLARALIPAPPQDVLNLGAMLGDDIALFNGLTPRAVANTVVNDTPNQAALFTLPLDARFAQIGRR